MLGLLTFLLSFHMSITGKTGSHSLRMMVTLIKGDTPFPELSAVVLLDDIQVMYYDTIVNKLVYRGQNNSTAGPGPSDFKYIGYVIGHIEEHMRQKTYYLQNHLNDTNNVWILQRTATCDISDDDQPGGLIIRDAYNGESGDVRYYNQANKTLHTDYVWPEAEDSILADSFRFIYEYIFHPTCISLLQKNFANERNRVLKKVKPRVRLLQKQCAGSTVLLTCLATGFYPRHINLTLLRDGQPVPDHQITGGELLPNGDETYQMRKSLEVSTEELQQHRYTCTAQHLSLDNKLDVHLDHKWDSITKSRPIVERIVILLVAAFPCLLGVVVFCIIYKRKHNGATETSEATEVSYSSASSTEDMDKGITAGKAKL